MTVTASSLEEFDKVVGGRNMVNVSRKLASEITHLNKKKAMDETAWTEIGKTRGIHSRRFYCLDFIIC